MNAAQCVEYISVTFRQYGIIHSKYVEHRQYLECSDNSVSRGV